MVTIKQITNEIMENTLKKEVFSEIKTKSPTKLGKVRSVYDIAIERLLMMASDNCSVYDVILKRQVYGKGENLNAISSNYFDKTKHIIGNHFLETVAPNTWLTTKAQPILVEMVLRKYLTGSAWKSYKSENGPEKGMNFCGVELREGYRENEILDDVIFTPTAKGQVKDFDIPPFQGLDPEEDDPKITIDMILKNHETFGLRKKEDLEILMNAGFKLYEFIHSDLESKGHRLADTKWEFGYAPDGSIILIDECVTPDSSRFWDDGKYKFSDEQNKFLINQKDKQHFRDDAKRLGLDAKDKKAELAEHHVSDEVMREGIKIYCDVRQKITGINLKISTTPVKEEILDKLNERGYLN